MVTHYDAITITKATKACVNDKKVQKKKGGSKKKPGERNGEKVFSKKKDPGKTRLNMPDRVGGG